MSDASEVKRWNLSQLDRLSSNSWGNPTFVSSQDHDRIVAELKTDVARLCETVRYLESTNPQLTDAEKTIAKLRAEVERLNQSLENERMRLAACGVAAMQNTNESRSERIDKTNPYWSASYRDVCRAVDSEIEYRETVARQAKQLELAKILYHAAIKLVDRYSKEKFPLNQTVTIEDVMRWYDKELEAIEQGEGK